MSPKILVTGATGNVGSEIVRLLINSGANFVAASHDPAHIYSRFGPGVKAVAFDFTDPATYEPALRDVRKIFLMRPPHITNVKKYIAPFVLKAKQMGVEHIVFLSLQGVQSNPLVPHRAIERCIVASGIPYTFLRSGFFMQNLTTTHLNDIRCNHDIFVPAGKGKTSFVDVRDIAAVGAQSLLGNGHRSDAYELTGSEALDYYQVAKIMSEELGVNITYSNPSPVRFFLTMVRRKVPAVFALFMIGIYAVTRFGKASAISSVTPRVLGRGPILLRQFIRDHRDCWT